MTEEIYVGVKPSKKGCLLVIAVALVAAIAALWGFRVWRAERKSTEPVPALEQALPAMSSAVPPAVTSVTPSPLAVLTEARRLKEENRLLDAREKAYEALKTATDETLQNEAIRLLGEINTTLVFSPHMMPEKIEYTVQSGDSLAVLARRFGTTVDAIRKGNRISGSLIRPGDRLRILNGKFRIEISKSRNILDLYLNDRLFKRYRVGTGEYGKTPTGDFYITSKVPQPTWWRPDGKAIPYGHPENVLGTHWLALNIPGYGIHGTWEPDTIGKQASAGCIRLLNEDVEELFTLVPEGTPVTIKDD